MVKNVNSNIKTKVIKKETKKTTTKKPVMQKTKKDLEDMFNFNFGCDCSTCPHHCGDE